MFLLLFIDKYILIIDVSASTFDIGDPMSLRTIDLQNVVFGAVIATAISVGACAGAPARSSVAGPFFGDGASLQAVLRLQAVRLCLGHALDIAGDLTALAKQF